MRLPLILCIGLLGAVLACEQIVEEPLPPHTPSLVLYAFLEPGQPIDAYLSRSFGALDKLTIEQLIVDDAEASLETGGQTLPLTFRDTLYTLPWLGTTQLTGKYEAGRVAASGETYTFRVSHPDYEAVTATTTVPQLPVVRRAWIEANVARITDPLGGDGGSQSLLKVEIDDPAGPGDYYEISAASILFSYPNYGPGLNWEILFVQGEAEISSEGTYEARRRAVPDDAFDGQTTVLSFLITLPNAYDDPATQDTLSLDIQNIVVETRTYGTAYAQYLEKLELQRATQSGGLNLFPAEAVVVTSNVAGGYGIVASYGAKRDSFPQ